MRYNTRMQANKVAQLLSNEGFDAKGYAGFTMTFPYVKEALNAAQSDGVEKLVVFYEGAQFSQVTAYIVFRHVEEYLAKHPEWKVEVIGVKSFSDDPRFKQQLATNLEKTWQKAFPQAPASDVCIFLPMHGNVMTWVEKGDPYFDQVMRNVDYLKQYFAGNSVTYGFQNHDEIPFLKWTTPKDDDALNELAKQECSKVLSSGQVSFTVDSLETLYDHAIGEREYLQEQAAKLGSKKDFALVPMFNSSPEFVNFLKDLSLEALNGQGDIIALGVGELEKIDLKRR
jgi:ferrochelatase